MSDFKDELRKTTIPKSNIPIEEDYSDFKKCISAVKKKTIEETYMNIKEQILKSSKTSNYIETKDKKIINGYIALSSSNYDILLTRTPDDNSNVLVDAKIYTEKRFLPPISSVDCEKKYGIKFYEGSRREGDNYSYRFCCVLLKSKKHDRFFGRPSFYHSYHLTPLAQNIIEEIIKLAANDDIHVSFDHIYVSDGSFYGRQGIRISDGENDKPLKRISTYGSIMLEYSISF